MSNEPEPRLIVYKAFGIPTDNGVFDDVKSGSLWPGNPPNFPRISKVVVWAPSGPGANGINGISVTYQLGPSGPDRVVENGEQSGTNYVVDIR
ncbi:hypothetical protein H0H87_006191 [Tephrocybe sp. NHM501043]|nr:hypothetical protein H0H87_006191 [Tephrocybe sp. NHM501043]